VDGEWWWPQNLLGELVEKQEVKKTNGSFVDNKVVVGSPSTPSVCSPRKTY
jgi:hypothetical protein